MSKTFYELTDSDDGAGGVGAWIPTEHFVDLILDGVVCYGQLSGKVTALNYDLAAGNGNTVNVRYVTPRTHACASSTDNCPCLSATSTTFGDYPINIHPWGDHDLVCDWSVYKAHGPTMAKIMNEMSKRMAMCRDAAIWADLIAVTPNIDVESTVSCNVETYSSSSCCLYQYNLYNSIIEAQKHMQGDAYDPDTVIMHPDVAKFLYWRDGGGYPLAAMPGLKFDGDGQLTAIGPMKVIESCNASSCSDAGGAVMVVIMDSKRAIGEAWGKRPTFNEFYDAKCNKTELVLWSYWGHHALDPNAIAWVSNP